MEAELSFICRATKMEAWQCARFQGRCLLAHIVCFSSRLTKRHSVTIINRPLPSAWKLSWGAESQVVISAAINAANPDIVWVGLGTPKQDWWVAKHRELLNAPVLIAVGAAFDFHSGRVKQAPKWMQRSGLEWLFRLSQDPQRLWRRYTLDNCQFAYEVLRRRLATRKPWPKSRDA
jgi:N-acetylglucosaminyldiphosphoundecaprenol N-acetyl-beta-D-mannosaminyltransferase